MEKLDGAANEVSVKLFKIKSGSSAIENKRKVSINGNGICNLGLLLIGW